MEVDTKVHNVDQRSRLVRFVHDAVGVLECEQRGSGSEGFVPGTSSVIWPVSMLLCRRLCEQPELVRGKAVVELGAGIGILSMVAAALGAARVVVTDMPEALPLLQRNVARCGESARDGSVSAAALPWGDAACIAAVGSGEFDVVLAADVLIGGWAHLNGARSITPEHGPQYYTAQTNPRHGARKPCT